MPQEVIDGSRTPLQFYVSPSGNDGNPGTASLPWLTVQHAADYIRGNGALSGGSWGSIIVNLAAGDYGTLALTAADSGVGRQVIYRGAGVPGSARLLGGRPVTGWTLFAGNIYRARVQDCVPQTLWENGVRARKARSPDFLDDGTHHLAQAAYKLTEGVDGSSTLLQYKAGDLAPGAWALNDAQVVIWAGGTSGGPVETDYGTDVVPITSLNLGLRRFTLAQTTRYPIYSAGAARYFIQGVLDLLDGPGQFHYDSVGQWLYYWPVATPIASQTIIIPTVQDVVTMLGADNNTRVSNVVLEGLGVEFSDFGPWYRHAYPNDGDSGEGHFYPGYDRQYTHPMARHGSIRLENADHITVSRCHVRNAGFHGIFMRQYNQGHRFVDSWIEKCALHGIYADGNYPHEGDVLKKILYQNLKLNSIGELATWGGALTLVNSGDNWAQNLDISDCTRSAIACYTYVGIAKADNYCARNRFSLFKIQRVCQDSGDTGAIYVAMTSDDTATNGVNTWDQGTIDQVSAHASMLDFAPNGIYIDGFAPGQVMSNIKVTNQAGVVISTAPSSPGGTVTNVSAVAAVSPDVGLTASFPTFA